MKKNNRPAASQNGVVVESGNQYVVIAVDMGENMRGLLTVNIAEGELDNWRETLMKMAASLQVSR